MIEGIMEKLEEYDREIKRLLSVVEDLGEVDIEFVEEVIFEKRFKRYEIFWMMFVLEKGLFRYKEGKIFLE